MRWMKLKLLFAIFPIAGSIPLVLTSRLSAETIAPGGRLEVNVTHVGFPAVGRGDIVRAGCWTPVTVDLALVDLAEFHGTVRAAQFDTDGDQCSDAVEVHLRAETGGAQRVTLYVPANLEASNGQMQLQVRDADGSTVQVISQGVLTTRATSPDSPSVVDSDDLVVLSLGTGTIGKVKDLAGVQQPTRLRRNVSVAHISPTDLPELWIGLEAVDYIVWDDARPEDLTERQLEAVIEWVRHGGTLLLAAARTAGSLKLVKPINAILPVEIGDITTVENLPETREQLLGRPTAEDLPTGTGMSWSEAPLPDPVPVTLCTARNGARRIAAENVSLVGGKSARTDIVTRRAEQRGHVIYCAVALRDLFGGKGRATTFFEKVFNFIPAPDSQLGPPVPMSLFNSVVSAVGFTTSRSLYLLITAVSFVVYVALATFGTWTFLSSRGMRHHAWTAFAVVAIACSFASVLAVGSIRGIVDRLEQIAIVDAVAGETFGRGTAFFGLKTGIDKHLDLWLPSDWLTAREPNVTSCFLKPLPAGRDERGSPGGFADPEEYRIKPASAQIDGVRFRATLKRFEGRWEGPLGGRLTGRITTRNRLITEDSFVVNELGVDLRDSLLIQTELDPGGNAAERNTVTFVYSIGTIPSDGMKTYLAARCYALSGSETLRDVTQRARLSERQSAWSAPLSGLYNSYMYGSGSDVAATLGRERDALMLLSTIGDFDYSVLGLSGGLKTWSTDRLRQLDLREQLTAGRREDKEANVSAEPGGMVLIGFADGGGPIRLFSRSGDRDYAAIAPEERASWCMYRIRLPFTVFDSRGGDTETSSTDDMGMSTDSEEEETSP